METFQQGNGERNTVKVVCCVRRGEHVPAHVVGRFLPYVSGRESRPHGHRGVKEAQRRSEAGFLWKGRKGTRDANSRNDPEHYPRPRQA